MNNDFYVYEWFNVDTNEVFYVGKGRKNRYKDVKQRNIYFKNYYNKHQCNVRKIKISLTEDEAFKLEIKLINNYKEIDQCKCNLTKGGEGSTFLPGTKEQMLQIFKGISITKDFSIMNNDEEYEYDNLKEKSFEELYQMYIDYREEGDAIAWFNSLNIYDKNGDLNIGWECFED